MWLRYLSRPVEPELDNTGVGKVKWATLLPSYRWNKKLEKEVKSLSTCILCTFISIASAAVGQNKPVLTVYAPNYFASEWGPGPSIESSFEQTCDCDLKYVTGDLLPRLKLEGEKTQADIVMGIDTDLSEAARSTELFGEHGQNNSELTLPIKWDDNIFLPFDWSYLAFVYDNTKLVSPPKSFDDLVSASNDLRLIIQDPRTSISGLSLALWVQYLYGEGAQEVWAKLAPKIVTVTKGWSEAYGLFVEGEADMVLSYTTSPAYHIIAEGDSSKSAAIFSEGHYLTVELVGKVKSSKNKKLADMFMSFVMSETFQEAIPITNWSYPSALKTEKLPQVFIDLPTPAKAILYSEEEASAFREQAINNWLKGLSN